MASSFASFGSLISFTLLYSSKVISRFSSWISISPLSSIAVMSTSFISIKMLAGRISFLYTVIVHGISSSFNSSSDTAPPIPKASSISSPNTSVANSPPISPLSSKHSFPFTVTSSSDKVNAFACFVNSSTIPAFNRGSSSHFPSGDFRPHVFT